MFYEFSDISREKKKLYDFFRVNLQVQNFYIKRKDFPFKLSCNYGVVHNLPRDVFSIYYHRTHFYVFFNTLNDGNNTVFREF